jgi:hypothetical protein
VMLGVPFERSCRLSKTRDRLQCGRLA